MDVKKCGAFLQALRKAKGLTQNQLAEVMCVSPKTISKWECGDAIPEITALMSLAEFYGVTVDEILRGERACAGVPVTPETEERNARANNLYLLNKKQDSLKLFIIIPMATIAVGVILQVILLFTVNYTIGICVNLALSIAAGATFAAGYALGGGHAEQYLEGDDLMKLNAAKLRAKVIVITALVCNVIQAIIPYFFIGTEKLYFSDVEITYTYIDSAALWLSPLVTFAAGAIAGLIVYYRLAAKYGVTTPAVFIKIAKLHLPAFLAIVVYSLFMFFQFWKMKLINYDGGTSYATENIRAWQCLYDCYLNPWLYVWVAALIAGAVLAVLGFKGKVHISVAYIVIGAAFMLFYGVTSYGAQLYAEYYCEINNWSIDNITDDCAMLTVIVGVVYVVCAVILALLARKKKTVKY